MIQSGFFNAINEDRKYNADSFNEFFNGILTENGVYKKSGDALKVVAAGDGMKINVLTGKARVNSRWVNISATETLELDQPDLTLNRYDAIVLRHSVTDRNIILTYIKGSSATTPNKPAIVRNTDTFDICLAYVHVKAGATAITVADIVDTRNDEALCSYVKLQIDTINAGIRQYRNVVNTPSEMTEISIGIPEYDAENDLLFANINGVMFVEGSDYTVRGTGSAAKIVLTASVEANNTIEFRVIKSVIEVL